MKERISLVQKAHELISDRLRPGGIAIDATVGNGYDTLFLLRQIAPHGRVYGFDIQKSALDSTRAKIDDPALSNRLTLFEESHAYMCERVPKSYHGSVDAAMFNLGYLPGGDKKVATRTDSTLKALDAASRLLSAGGIITIVAYPGHSGGAQETSQVQRWCETLARERFCVLRVDAKPNNNEAPRLLALTRVSL